MAAPPSGCRFHARCVHRRDICAKAVPPLSTVPDEGTEHLVRCWGSQAVAGGGWLLGVDRGAAAKVAAEAAHV
jgi:hypothetical protein